MTATPDTTVPTEFDAVDRADFSHLTGEGEVHMVDISRKPPTRRVATATGVLCTTAKVVELLRRDGLPKSDALPTVRVAGIMGAKLTPQLVPMCHPINLHAVGIELEPDGTTVRIQATVTTVGSIGVEMEALTAVAVCGLALVDMIKAVDPSAILTDVQLDRKEGGKVGVWTRTAAQS